MITTESTLPTINMDELKSIVEADNSTLGALTNMALSGSQAAQIETEKSVVQQQGIVQVMDDTGFLNAAWNTYVDLSGEESRTDADREAFTWALATAFQRGFMACEGLSKFGSTPLPKWIN